MSANTSARPARRPRRRRSSTWCRSASPSRTPRSTIICRSSSPHGGFRCSGGVSAAHSVCSLPLWAGLSHMSKDFEEEVFAPRSATHFSANRVIGRMHSQDVLGKTADDGEVFRPVVFAGASGVLVEHNVEDPVQLVL